MLPPRPGGQLPPTNRRQNLWFIIPASVLGAILVCGLGLIALSTLSQPNRTQAQATTTSAPTRPAATATPVPGNAYMKTLLAAEQHPPLFQDPLVDNIHFWSLQNRAQFQRGVALLLPGTQGGGRDKQNSGGSATRLQDLQSSFDLEIDVAYPGPSAAYGFAVTTLNGPGYILGFASNGTYVVYQAHGFDANTANIQAGGTLQGLAIKPGQYYHLAVLVQGNQIALFLNQRFLTVFTLSSGSFTTSHILVLGNLASASSPSGDVTFKNLTIYPV